MLRPLRYLYRRLGRRYVKAVLLVEFQASLLVALGAIGLLRLYQPMSDAHFWLIVLVADGLLCVENVWGIKLVFCLTEPTRRWLQGERDPDTTAAAWKAAATLPRQYLRAHGGGLVLLTTLPTSVFIALLLGLHPLLLTVPALFAGALATLIYGATLRFLAMEITMTPIVEDIAGHLPERFDQGTDGLSLRVKLLLGLPLINVITGVVVAGLSPHQGSVGSLGISVLVAVGVAFTLSFELTALLSRSILVPLGSLRRASERVGAGDLSVRVPVTTADETGRLTQAFNYAVSGLQERERLHEAFGAYVDPGLAERVLREGTDLGGEEVEVSVLFMDVREFTAFAERASAREVVGRLNDLFALVVPVLVAHGGHANKFVGDGLLGVFGAPDRRADHADRAVAAACEVTELVRRRLGDRLAIGVGVNSGPVVAGTLGGGGHVEFTVIGDAVNTAARVEQLTRETGDPCLVTEATRCLLSSPQDFDWVSRPSVPLKGKREEVRLWAPVARRSRLPPPDQEGRVDQEGEPADVGAGQAG